MDFILNEAEVKDEQYRLVFSDDENNESEELSETFEDRMFIDVRKQEDLPGDSRGFYRDLNNRENYVRFHNQTRNPVEVVNKPEDEYYGEDDMPKIYNPENRKDVDFDFFATDSDKEM